MCCICNINKFTVDGFSVISDLIYFLVLPVGVLFRSSIVNVCGWGGEGCVRGEVSILHMNRFTQALLGK